ncbi:MAG TPA: methylmalonyl-CoA mutase family protein [Chloroflexia bacterium]|nr:methylmalonyl-CoA mutase family protein [Chloroflexia bacterium]
MSPPETHEAWVQGTLEPALHRNPERQAGFETASGLPMERLYTPASLEAQGFAYDRDLGYPGAFPYTRGVQPTMYRGRLWTMRQYAGFGTAAESNARYRYLLGQGQTGLSVAFDLPTQMGYDPDHPLAEGEVGKVGVSIASIEDMAQLFDGIPLDQVSTSMTINATAAVLLALYIAVGRRQGVAPAQLDGTVQNDILKEYIARGTYIYPPGPSLRIITDLMTYCATQVPRWNTISISGYHIREAGSTAVQEVAFTLANAIAYVEAALATGLAIDTFAPRLAFFFNAHSDFFEEIAKYRAARRLWARLVTERWQPHDPRSAMMRFHTQTAGSSLTAQQPENNVVRVTLQALAAVLGGTQSLHTNASDEALALPTERSARTALRTQQILAYESNVAGTVDPLAGSYFVESLTTAIEAGARDYLAQIDKLGGTLAALEQGFFQEEIEASAYRWQQQVDSGERVIVGVNRFASAGAPPEDLLKVDPALRTAQIARLSALRASRDATTVQDRLQALQQAAAGPDNLLPYLVQAVEDHCTLGEICDALRRVFGEYKERR